MAPPLAGTPKSASSSRRTFAGSPNAAPAKKCDLCSRMKLDLNCDLGEGESPTKTSALMKWVTSANIATGGHAGDEKTMTRCILLAKKFGVKIGAHPGLWDRA